jgi:apolipoprotein D and lipocalin family protein
MMFKLPFIVLSSVLAAVLILANWNLTNRVMAKALPADHSQTPAKSPAAPNSAKNLPPLTTVPFVDINRYTGDWYEIALIPYFFQKDCVQDSKITYTPIPAESGPGQPPVLIDAFSCQTKNHKTIRMIGRAKVSDTNTNAKLSATFLNVLGWRYWFGENYWIIDLAPDYSYTVVGSLARQNAWIMARTPSLPKATLAGIADRLKAKGYDPCALKMSPQHVAGSPLLAPAESLCKAAY